jgi:hypothetical protein
MDDKASAIIEVNRYQDPTYKVVNDKASSLPTTTAGWKFFEVKIGKFKIQDCLMSCAPACRQAGCVIVSKIPIFATL